MLVSLLTVIVSFVAMEFVSYAAHRFVYHGIGWIFHKSHHQSRKGVFEWNDIFPVIFASLAITVMFVGLSNPSLGILVPVSIGVSLYGVVYFVIHDLYIHHRAKLLRIRIPFLLKLKQAHAVHHRYGGEPYGLLLFFQAEKVRHEQVKEDDSFEKDRRY